jgi:lipopolysaccharide biosynthesis glycosyltransferase
MNIVYSCDNNYISQTGISIISLFENNLSINELNIYLISKDISTDNLDILNTICLKYKRKLNVISFYDIAFDLGLINCGRHIETIYIKIFLARIIDLHKCIYLDSDTIINGSLLELWDINISDYYFAAVETFKPKKISKLNISGNHIFFNDGILLINVDYCRKSNLINQSINLINYFNGSPPILSEGILNSLCQNKVKIISLKFNLMSGMYQIALLNPLYLSKITSYSLLEIEKSIRNPLIIHFLSSYYYRPWSKNCSHPLLLHFVKYKNISPWRNQLTCHEKRSFRIFILFYLGKIIGYDNLMKFSVYKSKIFLK